MKYVKHWNAFKTVYGFTTGKFNQGINLNKSFVGQRLYEWYLEVCDE